jgi:hypothetical protein
MLLSAPGEPLGLGPSSAKYREDSYRKNAEQSVRFNVISSS